MKLLGVGKHTFLELLQPVLSFGFLFLGQERTLHVRITNKAPVVSFYRVKRREAVRGELFTEFVVEPREGSIPGGSTIYLKATYKPTVPGMSLVEHFDVVVPQMTPVSFACVGGMVRPTLKISSFSVSFGSVPSGGYSSRSITLKNRTRLPVMYQFRPADMGVFEFDEANGYIPPSSTVMMTVRFKPIEPLNYYARVTCIIKDQFPYYCDFVGTCFKESVKASTLLQCHVDRHRQVLASWCELLDSDAGLLDTDRTDSDEEPSASSEPAKEPGDLQSIQSERGTLSCFSEMVRDFVVPESGRHNSMRESSFSGSMVEPQAKRILMGDDVWKEYFGGTMIGWNPVTLDVKHIDFGSCSCGGSATQSITVRNVNGSAHVVCVWVVREPSLETVRPTGAFVDSDYTEAVYLTSFNPVFQVSPPVQRIEAGDAYTFTVTYRPNQDKHYYFKHLACFVHEVRDFRDDYPYILPPWPICVTAFGHSFPANLWEVRPEASFSSKTVIFPPALQGTCVYQTLAFWNHREQLLRFEFQDGDLPAEFAVTPTEGVISGKNFQLISFRYEAGETKKCTSRLVCKLNHSLTHELELQLVGTSHIPQIEISSGLNIYFKPANVGTQENLPVVISNVSGIHVQYEFSVPLEYADVLAISPASGVLRGKEAQEAVFIFSPMSQKQYSFQVPCSYAACTEAAYYQEKKVIVRNCPSTRRSYLTLDIEGEGMVGVITLEPQQADLGMLVIGDQYEHRLTLYNSTQGLLHYSLKCNPLPVADERFLIKFNHPTGTVPARAYEDVVVYFRLGLKINYRLEISCTTLAPPSEENIAKQKALGAPTTCTFVATAASPSLVITGIRSERFSAAQLWDRLQIDKLNTILGEPPKATESPYKYLFCQGKPLDEFEAFEFRFVTQNVGRRPSVVHLVLQCRVPLTVKWRIRLWNDTEVDMESWVEEGDPSEEEKRLVEAWKKRIFQVEPRAGCLRPGEEVHVRFTYLHRQEGFHQFPAILEIEKGGYTHLMLSGKTLLFKQRILGMQSNQLMLAPVAVGDMNAPVQGFELRNDGYMELTYEMDCQPLQEIEETHGFPVLHCLNPRGWIAPSESILINWIFRPLEPKLYGAELSFYVEGSKRCDFTIQGVGFSSSNRRKSLVRHAQQRSVAGKGYAWHGVPAKMSTEFVDFGTIKELCVEHRPVSLKNVSDEFEVKFNWRNSMAADLMVFGRFEVIPQSGNILPLKEVHCAVKFSAGIQPQNFRTTLFCDIAVVEKEKPPRKQPPQSPPPEEIIAKDGIRLTAGGYNKEFQRFPVATQMPQGMRKRLPHFKPVHMTQAPPITEAPPPPVEHVLFLTVTLEVVRNEKFSRFAHEGLDGQEDSSQQDGSTC